MSIFRKKTLASLDNEVSLHGQDGDGLKRVLNVRDLTLMGVAAVIGEEFLPPSVLLRSMEGPE